MNIEEIQSIMIDSYQVGYMEAVKAYEPAQDLIRLRDVKKWLRMMRIDWKRFNVLVNKELIKPIRKGESRNSPLYYSKAEIKQALSLAKVMKPRAFPSKVFLPGRTAMTCCADDTSFLGYVCRSPYAPKLKPGDWVKVRAKVSFKNLSVYRGEGPVLDAENIEPAEPIEEMVYFN